MKQIERVNQAKYGSPETGSPFIRAIKDFETLCTLLFDGEYLEAKRKIQEAYKSSLRKIEEETYDEYERMYRRFDLNLSYYRKIYTELIRLLHRKGIITVPT